MSDVGCRSPYGSFVFVPHPLSIGDRLVGHGFALRPSAEDTDFADSHPPVNFGLTEAFAGSAPFVLIPKPR